MATIGGSNIATDGLVLALDAANPRSYDPLAENLLVYSSLIGGTGYAIVMVSGSATLTASIAPDGTNTATLISQSGVNDYVYGGASSNLITSSIYTYSIFAKQGTKSDFTFTIDENGFGGKRYQFTHTFATNALSFGYTGNTANNGFIINSGSLDAGNGWRRIWGTFQTSTGSVSAFVDMIARFGSTGGTTYVWGRQLEKKSFPTSYIETTNINLPTSSTWSDLSGNNNSGSLINGLTYSSASNGSFTFNGTNQYVNLSNIPNSNFSLISSSFTTELWANFITGSDGTLISSDQSTTNGGSYSLTVRQNNIYSSFYGTPTFTDVNGGRITTGSWYHFVNTFNYTNQTSSMYFNGVLTGTGSMASSPLITSASLRLGRDYAGSGWFKGSIPSVKVYNRALSAQEVLQNYNAQKSRYNL
jgi:hypothetical protein